MGRRWLRSRPPAPASEVLPLDRDWSPESKAVRRRCYASATQAEASLTGGARRRRRSKRHSSQPPQRTAALKSMRSEVNLSELSDEDFIDYLTWHYPPAVVRDLVGIQQTSAIFREPSSRRPAKRRSNGNRRAIHTPAYPRVHRYITHTVVLTVAIAMTAHADSGPLLIAGAIGCVTLGALFVAKDAVRSAVVVTLRGRTRASSYELTVRVKTPSSGTSTVAHVLNLVSIFLPPEDRAGYVEDQIGNLLASGTRAEWMDYLIDQILELPRTAWQLWMERRRESVK